MRDIGKNIKQLRQMKNMTQDELAEKLYVTRQTVSNYEIGRTRPDIEMLASIAQVLDTDVDAVLYGPSEPVNRKRDIITSWVAVAAVILLFAARIHLGKVAKEYQGVNYEISPLFWVTIALNPIVYFAAGWTLLQVLSTFTKIVPLSGAWIKWIRLFVVTCIGIYCALLLPMVLAGGFPAWMPQWWLKAGLFITGTLFGYNQVKWYLLLGFLFGGLWWLFPWKGKK